MADTDPQDYEGVTIPGVEIFRIGTWNGERFTEKDLDDIVGAFSAVGYQPPVKRGHGQTDSDPAYGFVENLRRDGEKLVADFVKVPKRLAEMIRAARFNTVSSEIFFNLKRNGKTFRRALKAVALVGADIPGVSDLKPLSEISFGECQYTNCLAATEYQEPKTAKAVEMKTLKEAQEALDKAIEGGDADAIRAANGKIVEFTEKAAAEKAKAEASTGKDETVLELNALRDELKEFKQKSAAEKEETRQRWLDSEVQNVIPSVRPHVRAFLEMATTDENKVRKFTVGEGDASADVGGEALVKDMIRRLSKFGQMLTTPMAETGHDTPEQKTFASDEVHERTMKLIQKDPKLSYDDGQAQVLASDSALKERYASETN